MQKRLFSRDDVMGITKWFHYDDATEQVTIHTEHDVERIVEHAKRLQNNQTGLDRWGDGKVVATVPMTTYAEWVATGKVNDQAFIRRWLNDPENKHLRTFRGRV